MSIAEGLLYIYLGTLVGFTSLYLGVGILGSIALAILGFGLLTAMRSKWEHDAVEDHNSDV